MVSEWSGEKTDAASDCNNWNAHTPHERKHCFPLLRTPGRLLQILGGNVHLKEVSLMRVATMMPKEVHLLFLGDL